MGVVAVIGGGIRGLVSAYVVAKGGVDVVVYEKGEQLGGHATTVNFDATDLDLCCLFLNPASYATMLEMFDSLGVDVETSDVSFSVSHDKGNDYEWCSQYGFSNYFAQKKKLLNPFNWRNLREIIKFGNDVASYLELLENNPEIDRNETLGQFLKSRGYSENFQNNYLAPICGAMWSSSREDVMSFSAFSVLSFWRTHHLYQLFGQPQWLTIRRHSYFVKRVRDVLESRGCLFKLACQVQSVLPADNGTTVVRGDGFRETYNGCILAVSASKALRHLENPTFEEKRVLGAFQYASSDIYLHRDSNLMPKNRSAWSALNFLNGRENKACLTYWLNALQGSTKESCKIPCISSELLKYSVVYQVITEVMLPCCCYIFQNVGKTSQPFFLTVNPHHTPNDTLLKWSTSCAIPSVAASKGSLELGQIQGKRGIWFCGEIFPHEIR
ncbi:cyclopropane synthase [Gossypium australe]|uniref:Cyclopropane synthase n=1 Tax=Gossypium australe TaxID=47621 RepID=A0A5B6WD50_9ROSI|nr:cyclopropane synthase [Gossypium australe]